MLQVGYIRENLEKVISGLEKKKIKNARDIIGKVIDLDQQRRNIQVELDNNLSEANQVSKKIGILIKESKKEEAEKLKAITAELKDKSKVLADKFATAEKELGEMLYAIPNVPSEQVPAGNSAEDNQVVFENGSLPDLPPDALPHWELIQQYDIIDFELGNKITGAGFPVYKGKGAKLQRALINFFLDEAANAGYREIQPPVLINTESGYGTGQLPDKEGQMYKLVDEDYYLIPTAEVPITNLYRNVILKEDDLPVKNAGYSPCFRREAGSWGAHVRGLNRLHQFDKVEIVQIQAPENSYRALDEMCDHVKNLLTRLELPFRMVLLCGGDMGFTSAMTYDMEVFSGAQKKWLEVSSISNFETYQAYRLKLRYKDKNNRNQYLHTLNGSALALPRIVAALLENNQGPAGIKIPSALIPYTGFEMIERPLK
jgi:seryl-tRNA synthetase